MEAHALQSGLEDAVNEAGGLPPREFDPASLGEGLQLESDGRVVDAESGDLAGQVIAGAFVALPELPAGCRVADDNLSEVVNTETGEIVGRVDWVDGTYHPATPETPPPQEVNHDGLEALGSQALWARMLNEAMDRLAAAAKLAAAEGINIVWSVAKK